MRNFIQDANPQHLDAEGRPSLWAPSLDAPNRSSAPSRFRRDLLIPRRAPRHDWREELYSSSGTVWVTDRALPGRFSGTGERRQTGRGVGFIGAAEVQIGFSSLDFADFMSQSSAFPVGWKGIIRATPISAVMSRDTGPVIDEH